MDWCREVVRPMKGQLTRAVLIAAVAILYALIALPLPYLLIDHHSAMQMGDPNHAEVDVHAWLEWAAGSSLSGSVPVVPSVLVPLLALMIPSVQVFSIQLGSTRRSRGPPTAV